MLTLENHMRMTRLYLVPLLLALAILSPAYAQAATCAVGTPGATPSVTISFAVPTKNSDGSAIATPLTYNVYAGTTSGSETKQVTALKGEPLILSSGLTLPPNTTVYIEVSVTDATGKESAVSNEACKFFPSSPPGVLVITVT
jgi:hypothetical protein